MLHDWNTGKVPFYTLPPTTDGKEVVGSEGRIVSALGDQFDVMQAADAKVRLHFLKTLTNTHI